MLIFDCETNGFLKDLTTIHCLVIYDTATQKYTRYSNDPRSSGVALHTGLAALASAEEIAGQNALKFDIPAIQKVYPDWITKAKVYDTLIYTRLGYPDISSIDEKLVRAGKLPGKYYGAHKLEAWGYRMGVLKSEYTGDFAEWSQEMEDYCEQDVRVTVALWDKVSKLQISPEALQLEHDVTRIIARQEQNGFCFDEKAALALLATLSKERLALEDDLKARFGFWYAKDGELTPKRDDAKLHRTEGAPLTKIKQVYFNPSSRHHIARVLIKQFGWKPKTLTPTGLPEVNEATLKTVRHPEAATLLRYIMVDKRIGQIAEGKEAWLKYVVGGKIYGSVNTLGTVTGRMAHSHPNLGQVPASYSEYGKECRALFHARPGWSLVGADADALELRGLGHFMAKYDGGAYVKTILEGDKKLGTDMHSVNARAIGLDPKQVYRATETGRDMSKTWFYAFIYGAGDGKLGTILTGKKNPAAGKRSRAALMKNLPALGKTVDHIKTYAKHHKKLPGIDGRVLHVRSEHSAPNTLIQSLGAVAMKKALVILDNELQQKGLIPNDDYEFCVNVHDEWQIECRPELAPQIGEQATSAIRRAGEHYKLRCPLDGQYVVGRTWADTH